jgi:hypothetical protein
MRERITMIKIKVTISKLQEDWAYREEYKEAEGRIERLAWVT